MKWNRIRPVLLTVYLAALLAGCGNGSAEAKRSNGSQPAGVGDVLEAGMAAADVAASGPESAADGDVAPLAESAAAGDVAPSAESAADGDVASSAEVHYDSIDIDLTSMSSTMVYSEVSNMVSAPGDYIGKVVRMNGLFATYHSEASDKYYFACIIQDATACCGQGIEFELAGDYSYPDDYPEEGEDVDVVGVFDTYTENDYIYCTLRRAAFV